MVVLSKTLQVILAFSILIIIHELGHFLAARMFGIRVEKFYLFFDIGGKALVRKKIGQTEFGIGWLPFGGYCKIAGMIDESLDTEQMSRAPQKWEFRTHPAWQRLIVMAAGVFNNFVFAIIAYCLIAGIWGTGYLPNESTDIETSPLAEEMGFLTGDHILKLDDRVPEDFLSIQSDIVREEVHTVTVLRGADTVVLYVDASLTPRLLNERMFGIAVPFVVDSVDVSSPNGVLLRGDRVTGIGGVPVRYLSDAAAILSDHKGESVEVAVCRCGEEFTATLQVDSAGRLGVYLRTPEFKTRSYTFTESIQAGIRLTFSTIGDYLKDLRMVAKPSTGAYKSVGSFIAVGQVFPSVWDWYRFLNILALLSIMLAVMNLLPIPGLDGGHIVFTLYEILTGRKPSVKFLLIAQYIGMALLFALMFLAFGNDIGRLIH